MISNQLFQIMIYKIWIKLQLCISQFFLLSHHDQWTLERINIKFFFKWFFNQFVWAPTAAAICQYFKQNIIFNYVYFKKSDRLRMIQQAALMHMNIHFLRYSNVYYFVVPCLDYTATASQTDFTVDVFVVDIVVVARATPPTRQVAKTLIFLSHIRAIRCRHVRRLAWPGS